jgi:hypothetical protein
VSRPERLTSGINTEQIGSAWVDCSKIKKSGQISLQCGDEHKDAQNRVAQPSIVLDEDVLRIELKFPRSCRISLIAPSTDEKKPQINF